MKCADCHGDFTVTLVVAGAVHFCRRCYFAPLRGPAVTRKVGPVKDHSRQKPRQGSH